MMMGSKHANQKHKKYEVLITGMGGDGVVFAGEVLGLAATFDGKFASQRSTYGASQRGETLYSEIIVSDKPVQYTFIESPSFFIALSQQGFEAYNYFIKDSQDTTIFTESSHKYDLQGFDRKFKVIKLEARKIALEYSLPSMGNIIMLSNFVKNTKIVTKKGLEDSLKFKTSLQSHKQNLKALSLGWEL
jgi:2-oxoglutarate ferredoxin oxidoreductase subunit gamma